jgi:ADP-dependent NAD(P)H-hydrate dehydratase / NAD(P)H-hydrate epimerase
MRILNAAQMRDADRRTIEEIGIPSIVLMENAGRQVVAAMEARIDSLPEARVAILCGRGNNGGDGFVVARVLHQRGVEVQVFVVGSAGEIRGDARINLDILGRLGLTVVEIASEEDWEAHGSSVAGYDVIVDALFGTGLSAPLSGLAETVVSDVNAMGLPIVSVDLPSGLSADRPDVIGACVDASLTVTLTSPKLPLVVPPGASHAGDLVIADIGIPDEVIDSVGGPRVEVLTRGEVRAVVQPRASDSHKGEFGHVLVVSGSRGKTGAAHLAAMGALRSGAGLVTVATPRSCQATVAAMGAEYMTEGLDETPAGTVAATALDRVLALPADVIAVGPGLGTGTEVRQFVRGLLDRSGVPLVLDADALNAFAGEASSLAGREGLDIIITPHPGEMARLTGRQTNEVQADRIEAARALAISNRLYVVLKGHRTVIATPEGTVVINTTGNPGMASGGAGDVLTGMIAAWLAQLLDAEAACRLGVYLHGAAGDLAEADEGEVAMTAGDILSHLGDAVLELTARRTAD